jgi:hypothetical protein
MKRQILSFALAIFAINAHADIRELIDEDVLKQIAEETSGEAAKRKSGYDYIAASHAGKFAICTGDAAHTDATQKLWTRGC